MNIQRAPHRGRLRGAVPDLGFGTPDAYNFGVVAGTTPGYSDAPMYRDLLTPPALQDARPWVDRVQQAREETATEWGGRLAIANLNARGLLLDRDRILDEGNAAVDAFNAQNREASSPSWTRLAMIGGGALLLLLLLK